MVATDGHRLAVAKVNTPEPCPELSKGIIIPRKGLMEVKKLPMFMKTSASVFIKTCLL